MQAAGPPTRRPTRRPARRGPPAAHGVDPGKQMAHRGDAAMVVAADCRHQHRVGVPLDGVDRGLESSDGLRDPPVADLVKRADANGVAARRDGKLLAVGRPAAAGRGAVDAKQHHLLCPLARAGVEGPNERVAVLGAGHDAASDWAPIDARHQQVVLRGRGAIAERGQAGQVAGQVFSPRAARVARELRLTPSRVCESSQSSVDLLPTLEYTRTSLLFGQTASSANRHGRGDELGWSARGRGERGQARRTQSTTRAPPVGCGTQRAARAIPNPRRGCEIGLLNRLLTLPVRAPCMRRDGRRHPVHDG